RSLARPGGSKRSEDRRPGAEPPRRLARQRGTAGQPLAGGFLQSEGPDEEEEEPARLPRMPGGDRLRAADPGKNRGLSRQRRVDHAVEPQVSKECNGPGAVLLG